ncbi:hypothetical protein [Shewanella surugensis]|uniref:Uncharacterized protein n=1 Tax=Shewanella surugensis TaxID=212020 RepID=A0ABT0LHC8_9GAMM|nr:hypothetical protein [Shewanella surugensis]MCL1127070.1 hypothetical protein [Shewanella surugensis]
MKAQEAIAYASAIDKNLQLFADKETVPSTELKLWEVGDLNHQYHGFDETLGTHFEIASKDKLTDKLLGTVPEGQRAIVLIDSSNNLDCTVINLLNINKTQIFAINAHQNNVYSLSTIEDKAIFNKRYNSLNNLNKVSVYITGGTPQRYQS